LYQADRLIGTSRAFTVGHDDVCVVASQGKGGASTYAASRASNDGDVMLFHDLVPFSRPRAVYM
jgi:hypothetical protein